MLFATIQLHERNIIITSDHNGPMELSYHNLISLLEHFHPLFHIALLLLCGYVGEKTANLLKAPPVSGYIVIGMLLSPSILGVFHEKLVKDAPAIITDMALAIIPRDSARNEEKGMLGSTLPQEKNGGDGLYPRHFSPSSIIKPDVVV
jgi:hypothetical protein